jgi:hypothetical protein
MENIQQLLSEKSNEQRLAGLFLIPKVVQPDNESDIVKVFDWIDLGFLARLLNGTFLNDFIGQIMKIQCHWLVIFCQWFYQVNHVYKNPKVWK